MSAVERFCEGLRALDHEPEVRRNTSTGAEDLVVFHYKVEVGPRRGETVKLAFQVPPDWEMSPPSGPFVNPRLLPTSTAAGRGRPWDGVHEAHGRGLDDPDSQWQYWSRPYPANPGWGSTDKTVSTYMRHVRTLFGELPVEREGEGE